jgi:hypothetical protein
MKILAITPEVQAAIQALIEHARANPVNCRRIVRTLSDEFLAVGNDPAFVIEIPVGFRVVFSFEEQPKAGLCRHISISQRKGKLPPPEAVKTICLEFGFEEKPAKMWKEPIDAHHSAINVIQPLHQ